MTVTVLTIGHSNHTTDVFASLLRQQQVEVLVDVRSIPYSRFNPQFNRETLSGTLQTASFEYVYMGDTLGGRIDGIWPKDRYRGYREASKSDAFQSGLTALIETAERAVTTIMCAEKDPLDCHRTFLVARALEERGVQVTHVLSDGQRVSQHRLMDQLLQRSGLDDAAEEQKLFPMQREARLERAIEQHLSS